MVTGGPAAATSETLQRTMMMLDAPTLAAQLRQPHGEAALAVADSSALALRLPTGAGASAATGARRRDASASSS